MAIEGGAATADEVDATLDAAEQQQQHDDEEEEEEEDNEGADEEEEEEDEPEGEGEYTFRFTDGMSPLDFVHNNDSGIQRYQQFERLEYEALADRKRKALAESQS